MADKKKPFFEPVTPQVDFVELERARLKHWYKNGIVKKYLSKNAKANKRYRFLDGPITANNPMGVHHGWGRTYKDLWQRFYNMRGRAQRFQNGFDAQGLWVEVEVEKQLGFKSKKDIERYGIGKFVNRCKARVRKFARIQTEQSKRLGYFMDWDNSYYTLSDENNYMIWHFLARCHQRGILYKGADSVPWCPRCGTAISQHEILTEEYQPVTHKAIFVRLPVVGKMGEYLLVWTTTPWTLPANVAVAVNPKITYLRVKAEDGNVYFLAKAALARTLAGRYEVLEEMPGKKLVGMIYQGPFDHFPAWQGLGTSHRVVAADFAGEEEGTGLVHIAPGCGKEDYDLSKQENLPAIVPIDEAAFFVQGFDFLTGKEAWGSSDDIFADLTRRGLVYQIHDYTHRYPTCWRCRTELVFRLVDEWYIGMDKLRFEMIEVTKKIRWLPSWGLEAELDWLRNMDDWLISKKRYWGLALPIWECHQCGSFYVIGSKEELRQKAVEGWTKFSGHSPHRPWVDNVKIKCASCGEVISRIPDVGNPWLDAGIVPFSTLIDPKTGKISYLSDQKYWQNWFPADFITENIHGQFKNWFYSLIAMSTVLENTNPFKTVLGHALVRDEHGEEMHKSRGNVIWFDDAVERMGADVMRWVYLRQNPFSNLSFGYPQADEARRRFHLPLWNVYNFFVTYANLANFRPKSYIRARPSRLDAWILARISQTNQTVTETLENFDAFSASQALEEFVSDLSTWYVRRSRDRVGAAALSKKDRELALFILWKVLVDLCRLLAPFTPFLADEIYTNLTGKESVHLADWPEAEKLSPADKKLLSQMQLVRQVTEAGHAARKGQKIRVRQPLARMTVEAAAAKPSSSLLQLIKEELNIEEIRWKKGTNKTPRVTLYTRLSQDLRQKGRARELVRQLQDLRKKKGLPLDAEILAYAPDLPEDKKLLDFVRQKTLSAELLAAKTLSITIKEAKSEDG